MTTQPLAVCNTAIRQRNGLYSFNDLHRASGGDAKHKPHRFIRLDTTQALIAELSKSPDMGFYIETTRGRYASTYACRELVIAYAAWISAAFQLKVIRVFLDTAAPQPQPAQQALPMNDVHTTAPGLDASLVNEIVTSTTHNIVETLKRKHLLTDWHKVIEALQNPKTEMTFSDLTSLTQACLARLQRNIKAEAYDAIARRAANRNQSTAAVSLAA